MNKTSSIPLTDQPETAPEDVVPIAVRRLRAERARQEGAHEGEAKPRSLAVIDAFNLIAQPVPPRRWHVENGWMPADDVTLLGADGGEGKTTLAMQLAWCTVCGFPWLGNEVRAGAAVYFTAEEPVAELHFRLSKIREAIGLQGDPPHPFKLITRAEADAVLAYPGGLPGTMQTTPLFDGVVSVVREIGAKLLVLDAAADIFGGDEVNRAQVRSFIRLLRSVALSHDCAVLLLSHPSVDGIKTGRGYSGSTHWSNAVRSRFYFTTPKKGDGEPDQDLRELDRAKANRSRRGVKIGMRWSDGHFAVESPGTVANAMNLGKAKATFLELLATYTTEGRNVSHHATSPSYAPKVFASDVRAGGIGKHLFRTAMNTLFADKRLTVQQYGRPSRPYYRLAEVGLERSK
jgi:RecA-family ATPase